MGQNFILVFHDFSATFDRIKKTTRKQTQRGSHLGICWQYNQYKMI